MYDVVIIGCGVIGAATAYELSRYDLKIAVLEKENDIADGTTKANSAIVHAGYDPEPGTAMAHLNVRGNAMIEEIAKKLSVHYQKCGSLVLAFNEDDLHVIYRLYRQGVINGVPGIRVLNTQETLAMEPNLSTEIKGALYAPSGAIVSPWELCIAMADTAKRNGVDFFLNSKVDRIERTGTAYRLYCGDKMYEAARIVNAAGLHSDDVHNLVAAKPEFRIIPSKGQYYLLDKSQGSLVSTVIFQCPSKVGKGILVSPTVHGNLIVGPDAVESKEDDDVSTTQSGLDFVREIAVRSVPGINFRDSIRNFAGVRAQSERSDFIIEESKTAKGFINLAGIKSPGLTSAPAIALECIKILEKTGVYLKKKENFIDERNKVNFKSLSPDEKEALIEKNPLYGRVICRCETITEGEIVDAIHSPITPRSVDAIKKRCNAGMGRCQGGFCGPRVQEILARELHIPLEDVLLNKDGTFILTGETKKGGIQQ
nr:NAD(P)/FAD-dependent oxidoreductase [uncultured Caproiciproducens sp.]